MASTLTQHAKVRMRQRGICPEAIFFIEKYGDVNYGPGGVQRVVLLKKKKGQIIGELKKTIKLIEKAAKIEMIRNGNKVITVYHK